jgi:cytoskeletal protein RodZ
MDRNQKIALGCGGAGCLGLLAIVIVCVVLVMTGYITMPGGSTNRNENFNANPNSNSNLNGNSNSNAATSSSSLSDDDKHKLFQAAGMTRDTALIQRVLHKLGFLTPDNAVSDDYEPFVKSHTEWAKNNYPFIRSVLTPEKARAYVEAHIND